MEPQPQYKVHYHVDERVVSPEQAYNELAQAVATVEALARVQYPSQFDGPPPTSLMNEAEWAAVRQRNAAADR
jgi:hypothetical protein